MTAEVTETPVAPEQMSFDDLPQENTEDQLNVKTHDELDRLDPLPEKLALKNGMEFEMSPLRLRQFLALLRILTRGATPILASGGLSSRDGEDFARQLLMLLMFAIPESEEETVEFVKTLAKPKLTGNPQIDEEIKNDFDAALDDPELEDIVLILQALVENEAEDLRSLGNRLRSMLTVASKMGLTRSDEKKTA